MVGCLTHKLWVVGSNPAADILFFHSNRSFNAKFRSNSVQKSRIVQFCTLWQSKDVHGLNLQASAANLHIVKILRDIEGSFYNSYGIQGLEMTFWALYFHTPICHSAGYFVKPCFHFPEI